MIQKLAKIILAILLGLLPFFSSTLIGKYTPYIEGNSFTLYVAICFAYAFLSALVLYAIKDKTLPKPMLYGGVLLFFMGACIASIAGLVAPPDISPAMLQHPEREHFRYLALSLSLLLFAGAFILIIRDKWNVFPKWNRWILIFFLVALVEMCWEFYHHYHYAENLKLWMEQGKNPDAFIREYDSFSGVRFGAIGRICQYITIAWLAYILVQCRHNKYWSFIPILLLSVIGILSAIIVFNRGFSFPKGFEILLLFFIPGFPFILLYWTGVALLSKPIVGITQAKKKTIPVTSTSF